SMNVRNVWRKQRLITVVPDRKRKGQDLDKTRHVTRGCAPCSPPNAITSARGIPFRLIDLVNGHKKLGRSDDKIRNTATEFPCRTIIIRRWILNIGRRADRKADDRNEGKDNFHRGFELVNNFAQQWQYLFLPFGPYAVLGLQYGKRNRNPKNHCYDAQRDHPR